MTFFMKSQTFRKLRKDFLPILNLFSIVKDWGFFDVTCLGADSGDFLFFLVVDPLIVDICLIHLFVKLSPSFLYD